MMNEQELADMPQKEAPVMSPIYDPRKNYTWNPEDVIEMSGQDFMIILNTFRNVLNTPETSRILMTMKANDVAESILAKAVSSGIAREADPKKEG